jgi:hypothetical protein
MSYVYISFPLCMLHDRPTQPTWHAYNKNYKLVVIFLLSQSSIYYYFI